MEYFVASLALVALLALTWTALFRYSVVDQGRRIAAWKVYRPEGHPIEYTLKKPWRILWYVRKYRKKNFEVSDDLLAHFNAQRKLLAKIELEKFTDEEPQQLVKLAAVGDIMWVRTNWENFLDPDVKRYLAHFDVVLGNLESPIDRSAPPVEWYKIDAAKFNSDIHLLTAFFDVPSNKNIFTALSTANNHCFDRGDSGAIETIRVLDELGIKHSGVHDSKDQSKPAIFEKNGLRFGFYSTCYGYNDPKYRSSLHLNVVPGLAPCPNDSSSVDCTTLMQAIEQMEAVNCDFKVLYIHWGHEFELYPTKVQTELGRKFASLGFDLIVGSHPHVVQPSEVCFINGYESRLAPELSSNLWNDSRLGQACIRGRGGPRKALIHYSLGNFITAMLFWEPKYGAVQSLEVFRTPLTGQVDWRFPACEFVYNALSIHNRGRKELLLLRSYFDRNRAMIERDFPRNRASAAYLIRHLRDEMTAMELRRGPHEGDYRKVIERLEQRL